MKITLFNNQQKRNSLRYNVFFCLNKEQKEEIKTKREKVRKRERKVFYFILDFIW